jgi:hypothetical protein
MELLGVTMDNKLKFEKHVAKIWVWAKYNDGPAVAVGSQVAKGQPQSNRDRTSV